MTIQTWDLWIPDVAARGISFARGRMDAADEVLVHSAPTKVRVEVRDHQGGLVAFGDNLPRTTDSPMSRLHVREGKVEREETWPSDADYGLPVILPGGEVGLLRHWWNSDDRSEWRWTVDFYNHR